MSRLISMEDAIRAIEDEWDGCCSEYPATQIIYDTTEAIEKLPIIQPEPHWIPVTKEEMFKAGYEGREIRFKVDGRLFAIRELAQ